MGVIRFIKPLHKELLGAAGNKPDLRLSASQRGYDHNHRKWRAVILRRDPICKMCNSALSTHADHIIPINQGGSKYDYSNGQGLCVSCHNRKSRMEQLNNGKYT
jgi:5-methylcytosine-specific restriction endonuclease McrA